MQNNQITLTLEGQLMLAVLGRSLAEVLASGAKIPARFIAA